MSQRFLRDKHEAYLRKVIQYRDQIISGTSSPNHLEMSGAYWSLTAMRLMRLELSDQLRKELVDFVMSCQNEDGGFGGSAGLDSHINNTLYAVLILMEFDRPDLICKEKIAAFVGSLWTEEPAAFKGDRYGEIDGRFCYTGAYLLKVIGQEIPNRVFDYFDRCRNYDGGFGGSPDAESHAAYTFCAVAAISVMGRISEINTPRLRRFLAIRQTAEGGFNGRPEKLPDVCYSWWVLSAAACLDALPLIDLTMLEKYILSCQDDEEGGFTDRPGNGNDVFHTFFAIAALSLIDHAKYDLLPVDPTYAIPSETVKKYIPL